MSIATIMQRLQQNFAEISGVARAMEFTPTQGPDMNDMPFVYPFSLGGMTDPVPNTGGEAGEYEVIRRYGYRMLHGPQDMATVDSDNIGSPVDAAAVLIIDNVINYFIAHPRLDTVSGGGVNDLGLLTRDVTILDTGVVTRPGPDGAYYRATDYTITVGERRIPASSPIS